MLHLLRQNLWQMWPAKGNVQIAFGGHLVTVTFDLITLIFASIPLGIAIFVGAWTLFKFMVFDPLHEISNELKDIKQLFHNLDTRVSIIESKDHNTSKSG